MVCRWMSNQCLDKIQSTTAKFNTLMHSPPGGGGICAPFAHRAVSAMYRGLRWWLAGEQGQLLGRVVIVGDGGRGRRRGAELGVGLHTEALVGAAAAAHRAAVLAAPAWPAREVRCRAQGVDVRELPAPVSLSRDVAAQIVYRHCWP
jgi:hypothetical protein